MNTTEKLIVEKALRAFEERNRSFKRLSIAGVQKGNHRKIMRSNFYLGLVQELGLMYEYNRLLEDKIEQINKA